jgi:hypothetical protein
VTRIFNIKDVRGDTVTKARDIDTLSATKSHDASNFQIEL